MSFHAERQIVNRGEVHLFLFEKFHDSIHDQRFISGQLSQITRRNAFNLLLHVVFNLINTQLMCGSHVRYSTAKRKTTNLVIYFYVLYVFVDESVKEVFDEFSIQRVRLNADEQKNSNDDLDY